MTLLGQGLGHQVDLHRLQVDLDEKELLSFLGFLANQDPILIPRLLEAKILKKEYEAPHVPHHHSVLTSLGVVFGRLDQLPLLC